MYYLLKPEDENIKELYARGQKAEQVTQELPVDLLEARGFTPEQIAAIKVDIAKGVESG
jgi:hypothetical protein